MWRRGKTLGKGHFGLVSLAFSQQEDYDDNEEEHNIPSIMAVKSANVSRSHSLRKEKKLLHEFGGCPHIIRCFGSDSTVEDGVQLYNLFLEYASKGSLADRIKNSGKGLPDFEVRQYTKSILNGLRYIHNSGYVHCDIKPHNILLMGSSYSSSSIIPRLKSETAQIADFGLARKMGTKSNSLRGTPLYLAPESITSIECGTCGDIWALGCTVLQMITGEPPWHCGPNSEICSVLFKIGCTQQVPEIPSWVSKEAEDFLKKCLVRDPNARWTADMLLDHPFITNRGSILQTKLRENLDDSCSIELPKPYAIMGNFGDKFNKLVAEKKRRESRLDSSSVLGSYIPLNQEFCGYKAEKEGNERIENSLLGSYIPLTREVCGDFVSKKRKITREEVDLVN